MLEFYPLRSVTFGSSLVKLPRPTVLRRNLRDGAVALSAAALIAISGCATQPTHAPAAPVPKAAAKPAPATTHSSEPPPANVNLSGFPLAYRQGYADGCASLGGGEHKDAARFASDGNYRTGWQDGLALCKKR